MSFCEGDCMKKIIPIVLFCVFVLSTLFLGCEPLTNQKNEIVPTLSSIIIDQKPAKLIYNYEETLDLTGLIVKAKYSDGSEKTVDGWTSDPKPWSKLKTTGTVTVTITYEEKTASFTIKVSEKPAQKTLSSIYISKQSDKLDYEYNSLLDLTGLEVKGKYSDGTEEVLEGWTSNPKAGSNLTTSGTVTISYEGKTTSFTITVATKPVITSKEYFWGTWVRMDNGKEYEVLDTSVVQGMNNYKVTASDSTTLTVNSLGTFTKESDSVMLCNNIPYFRKGGANLEYSLKLVGFTTNERAAGTVMSGIKGKGKSSKYTNFESEGESDSKGEIKLKAPTANDTQTVEILYGDDVVVIPGLKINNSGDYMGTVALVGKDDYNLKITGTISDDQKDNGYLFGNNAKTYNMQLTITNISDNKCSTSTCSIESEDNNLVLSSDTNLKGFTISTLAGGATKTISISLSYGEITAPYIDTGLTVTIKNPLTKQEWNDYIPLRFFKGTIPITIAARNPENNNAAALNGFVIYPDGNNQFFAIQNNKCSAVFVPTFGSSKPYMLVFSGATVTSQLDDSTEMYYTVEPASINPKTVITDGDVDLLSYYIVFGGENHSETAAYNVTEGFEAYLSEGEIDYYKLIADSDTYYGPGGTNFYSVSYVNEKGDVPDVFIVTEGEVLSTIQLPEMNCDGYKFLGWYSGTTKVIPDSYMVQDNITLTAKWQLESYPVVYNLNGGTNHAANPSAYTIESSTIALQTPIRTGYDFDGWFITEALSGSAIETIGGGTTGGITLYAKWTPVAYKITYELNGGTNVSANPATYTIETDTITLAEPQKEGFVFGGWYTDSNFSGTKQTTIEKGFHTNIKYYAKWLKKCTVSYVTAHSTAPTAIIVCEGEKLTAEQLPELINSDYFFGGWFVGETDVRVTAGSYTVNDDVTLKAHWSISCMISYNSAHGTLPDTFYVPSGTSLTAANLPRLTESGWKFLGWYTNNSYDKDKKASAGQSITTSITLYAKWEEYTGPDDDFVFVEGGTVVGDISYNQDYTGAFPAGRTVILSSFYISDHELTQGEYRVVMGSNPSYDDYQSPPVNVETQENRPVGRVSWLDAIYFCNKYSEYAGLTPCYSINGNTSVSSWNYNPHNGNSISGIIVCDMNANGYRLPTEAEWEYAARGGQETYGTDEFADYFAGTTTTNNCVSSNSDLDSVGWYSYNICNDGVTGENEATIENTNFCAYEVRQKAPNALGIYDMSGNIWEWCWDLYDSISTNESVTDPCGGSSSSERIMRGGSYVDYAFPCSVSYRKSDLPEMNPYNLGFRLVRSANNGSNNTESSNSNANQTYSFTSTVTVLPAGTDGTAGASAKYVHFGDWPQTIKADNVAIDENVSEVHGAFKYYSGSDGFWYVKCTENAFDSISTYSNGTIVEQSSTNSTKYFKVEPIKWRVLTDDYNGTGKALLLAENILTANVEYYPDINRYIISSSVYPNNYKESKIRAYLNGLSYYEQSSSIASMTTDDTYSNKGFLQTAFTTFAQELIATTNVDNSASSTTNSGNNMPQATSYACANTSDKIFLLSEKEVTTTSYGFASYGSSGTGNTRIRVTTDFAKANYARQNTSSGYGSWWWLRSPYFESSNRVWIVLYDGYASSISYVYNAEGGIVPALTISL